MGTLSWSKKNPTGTLGTTASINCSISKIVHVFFDIKLNMVSL